MEPNYRYFAIITNVVDGDIVDATVDLGFHVSIRERFRLYGIDTPEKNSKVPEDRLRAQTATDFVRSTVLNKQVVIESVEKDKYGRWLAKIYMVPEQPTLNEHLITLGHAKAYFGGPK